MYINTGLKPKKTRSQSTLHVKCQWCFLKERKLQMDMYYYKIGVWSNLEIDVKFLKIRVLKNRCLTFENQRSQGFSFFNKKKWEFDPSSIIKVFVLSWLKAVTVQSMPCTSWSWTIRVISVYKRCHPLYLESKKIKIYQRRSSEVYFRRYFAHFLLFQLFHSQTLTFNYIVMKQVLCARARIFTLCARARTAHCENVARNVRYKKSYV